MNKNELLCFMLGLMVGTTVILLATTVTLAVKFL
jgi:hypothetical protein